MIDHGTACADARAREFDWPGHRVFLNAASFAPLPLRTRRAIDEFNAARHDAALTDGDLTATLVAARSAAARLIGADTSEIALAPNTNAALNVTANAVLRLAGQRRVILVSAREFPANVYPWLALERAGFTTEILPVDERGLPQEARMIERIRAGDVAACAVSFVQFASGYRADLAAIGSACREHGTLFIVDAIQGLGAVPLAVRDTHADLLACGGQKWLCSPWGSGFTYVRRELIESFELDLPGWLGFEATQDFNQLTDYRYDFLDDARRFEVGSLPFQDFLGFARSVELLVEIGVANIWQHIRALQQPIIDWAARRGVEVVSTLAEERRSGILCIRPARVEQAFAALKAADIRCALRESAIRVSPHWYNTPADVARFLEVLDSVS